MQFPNQLRHLNFSGAAFQALQHTYQVKKYSSYSPFSIPNSSAHLMMSGYTALLGKTRLRSVALGYSTLKLAV